MREIKFRAWDEDYKFMTHKVLVGNTDSNDANYTAHCIWIESGLVDYTREPGWMNFDEHSNIILMQYTGIKNTSGAEIYEGDIVEGPYWEKGIEHRFVGQVKFGNSAFKVVGINQCYGMNQELHMLYEVIGNIYENPNLLEGESK